MLSKNIFSFFVETSAPLVNASRSGLIAKDASVDALKAGRPIKAAVNVYDEESAGTSEQPIKMDNVTCTPVWAV